VGSYELDSSVGSEFEARTFDGAFRLKPPGTSNFIEEIRRGLASRIDSVSIL